MSKADKMFENLGYEKLQDNKNITEYIDKDINNKVVFYKNLKEVAKLYNFGITMQELQAINERCKELGWLDE